MSRPGRAMKSAPYLLARLLCAVLAFLSVAAVPAEKARAIVRQDWERAAAVLEQARGGVPDAALLDACLLALRDIAGHEAEYDATRPLIPAFAGEAEAALRFINRATAEDAFMMPDYLLGLFECCALMVRAACLSKPAGKCRPEQRVILDYFEKSGYWQPADESSVSDCYYIALPEKTK